MTRTLAPPPSQQRTRDATVPTPALLRALLICGVLSSPLYLGIDLLTGLRYEGYSFVDQMVSELAAIGAPTRPIWLTLGPVYQLLMLLFGVGVWMAAGRRRTLRITAGLIVAYGLIGFSAPFTPMHTREFLVRFGPGLSDRLHLAGTAVAVLLMFTAIGFAAAAFGRRFRVYSISTVVLSFALGAWTSPMAPRVEANLPTPWMGAVERASIALMMVWVVVFALVLLRRVAAEETGQRNAMGVSAATVSVSRGGTASRWWHTPSATRTLLVAGIGSVVVYGVGDLASGLLYDGYSFRDQWISELTAFGSPVRPFMVTAILAHGLLLLAFGVGLRRAADRRSLRWVGMLLIVAGVIGFPTHTLFAMSSRWMPAGFNDTMHASLSVAFSLVVFVAVVLSAVAYRGWFRLYSMVTIAVLIGSGAASSVAIQGLEQNSTPWAGGFERINAYAYFAWLVVLAVVVARRSPDQERSGVGSGR